MKRVNNLGSNYPAAKGSPCRLDPAQTPWEILHCNMDAFVAPSFSQEAILISCAALLSAYFGGVQLADLDRTRVYEIPASYMTQMSVVERTTAKACAARHGIRYKIIQPGQTVANAQN